MHHVAGALLAERVFVWGRPTLSKSLTVKKASGARKSRNVFLDPIAASVSTGPFPSELAPLVDEPCCWI